MRHVVVAALSVCLVQSAALAEEAPPPAAAQPATAAPAEPQGEPSAAAEPGAEDEAGEEPDGAAQLEASLRFQSGDVVVGDNLATLHLGDAFRYLGPEDTEKVLVAWGNPPGSSALGMLFPKDTSPFAETSWGVVISYSDDGHVEDEDAADTDFDELLSDMKKDTEDANAERQKQGYGVVHLVGWAEPPHYDAKTHKLYWAKELDFGSPEHTLNYDIRALGRKGVLELSAVASVEQLAMIKTEMPKVLAAVEFNQGMRYADFNPDVDEVAAYGIGALVAGKVAAKAGLFKVIVAGLLASKKLLVAGALAIGVVVKKLLGRSSDAA